MIPNTSQEVSRQRALDRYRIVDSIGEEAYDDIVRVASELCDAPMALVTLIDRDRQWFKASTGLDDMPERQTSREVAFCDHAIRTPQQLMEVMDARQDPRFAENPFVTGDPNIRFYAGAPLVTPSGEAIGTVCVLDREPRMLTQAQRAGLKSLARLAMTLMESRHREQLLGRAALALPLQAAQPAMSLDAPEEQATSALLPDGYSVLILELQDFAGVVERMGERATEKALIRLDHAIEAHLHRGDVVNRASGSPEFIVVVQGTDLEDSVCRLREAQADIATELDLQLQIGAAAASSASEALEDVFERADAALSAQKTAAVLTAQAETSMMQTGRAPVSQNLGWRATE